MFQIFLRVCIISSIRFKEYYVNIPTSECKKVSKKYYAYIKIVHV